MVLKLYSAKYIDAKLRQKMFLLFLFIPFQYSTVVVFSQYYNPQSRLLRLHRLFILMNF